MLPPDVVLPEHVKPAVKMQADPMTDSLYLRMSPVLPHIHIWIP